MPKARRGTSRCRRDARADGSAAELLKLPDDGAQRNLVSLLIRFKYSKQHCHAQAGQLSSQT